MERITGVARHSMDDNKDGASARSWGPGGWRLTGDTDVAAARPICIRILARSATGQEKAQPIDPEDLEPALLVGDVVWADVLYPDPSAALLLSERLHLSPLTVEDCLLPVRMPKLDSLPDGDTFVAVFGVRLVEEDGPRLRANAVALVVAHQYLVSMRREPMPELEARLEALLGPRESLSELPAVLAHAAIDALVDRHLPTMLLAAEVAEELEERLDPQSEHQSVEVLERLIVLRRDLLAFRRLGVAQQEVLRRLGRALPAVGPSLSDVADSQREAVETAAATCDYIDGAIEGYRLRREARTEIGIRRLTVLAAILGPLSLLIGLWEVKFPNIPGSTLPWGWFAFVFSLLLLALLSIGFVRRRGLL
jgi:Mg2+ and Co2+ transporter CorA